MKSNEIDMLRNEETFHDEWSKFIHADKVKVEYFFEACTAPENRLILERLGNLKDQKILEVGCGAAEASIYFAKMGAEVTATDVSEGMLQLAKKIAENHGVSIKTRKCSAAETPFSDESFDIVYAANLLHHVDIEKTLREGQRVLKRGGVFVSWDPLAHNPIINIYRKKASLVRTQNEHPLYMSELQIFRKHFSGIQYETTWLFTQLIFLKFYFIDRINPNEERYWKKVINDHKKLEKLYRKLEKIDKLILRAFPILRRYCWNIIIFGYK